MKKGIFAAEKYNTLIKIAITGPESTGKSELAQQLALHFNTFWVPEYAREYIKKLDRPYVYDDILAIAKGQIKSENKIAAQTTGFLFCDTELLVTKIWCNFRFQKCHKWIEKQLEVRKYNLLLLCDIDLPWEYDEQRENPNDRNILFELYRKEIERYKFTYEIIHGFGDERLQNALKAIEKHF